MNSQPIRIVEIEKELRKILDSKMFEERMLEHPVLTLRRTSFQHKADQQRYSNDDP